MPAPAAAAAPFVTDEVKISERPAEADDRAVPGHWEGDLIIGLATSAIGTLVERTSRYTMLLHLPRMDDFGKTPTRQERAAAGRPRRRGGQRGHRRPDREAARTAAQVADLGPGRRAGQARPAQDRRRHRRSTSATRTHPGSAPSNENTNGLLRQYFPKGTDLSRWTAEELDAVVTDLNARPRKTLNWRTPAEVYQSSYPHPTGRCCIDPLNLPSTRV